MKFIDLTQKLYNKMPVYPNDPAVEIKQVFFLAKDGWNMNTIFLPTHIGTHVNVPIHAVEGGKTLDDYSVDSFVGKSVVFNGLEGIKKGIISFEGLVNIDKLPKDKDFMFYRINL